MAHFLLIVRLSGMEAALASVTDSSWRGPPAMWEVRASGTHLPSASIYPQHVRSQVKEAIGPPK